MSATKQSSRLSPSDIAGALKREPLIGVSEASRILGVIPSNFKRDHAPKLLQIEAPVSGNGRPLRLYFRSEVEQLAAERNGRNGRS